MIEILLKVALNIIKQTNLRDQSYGHSFRNQWLVIDCIMYYQTYFITEIKLYNQFIYKFSMLK